ncbi:MAG TPA: hypothetical protein DCQ06_03705 [Myxococcales bacterium]|nr:hypothetical protein [Myxococcales bacterium]
MRTLITCALLLVCMGCESEDASGPAWPKSAQLTIDQGLILSTGELVPGASYLKVDVIVRKHGSSNFDLKPGGSGPSEKMLMHVFKTGGVAKVFDSLEVVPDKKPSSADFGDYLDTIKTGNAVVVQNNVGDGFTKLWVKRVIASAGLVEVEFQPVPQ